MSIPTLLVLTVPFISISSSILLQGIEIKRKIGTKWTKDKSMVSFTCSTSLDFCRSVHRKKSWNHFFYFSHHFAIPRKCHECLSFAKIVEGSPPNFTSVLNLSWRRPLSYRNQSIDLLYKSMDWFLYDNGLRHERIRQI